MTFSPAHAFVDPACRPVKIDDSQHAKQQLYSQGLLWKVSKQNGKPSYMFGTIHVSDKAILALPALVDATFSVRSMSSGSTDI